MIDGTLSNSVPFTAASYIEEYEYHLLKVNELFASETHGAKFKAALELWATIGWYVSAHITFSLCLINIFNL